MTVLWPGDGGGVGVGATDLTHHLLETHCAANHTTKTLLRVLTRVNKIATALAHV